MKTGVKPTPAIDRALARLIKNTTTGCLEWPGALSNGYGVLWSNGRLERVHRVVFEFFNGPIPEGLQIDHLCRNKTCSEPTHLEAVTQAENIRRGWVGRRPTECKHGHALIEGNVYRYRGAAVHCRACAIRRSRESRLRKAGLARAA